MHISCSSSTLSSSSKDEHIFSVSPSSAKDLTFSIISRTWRAHQYPVKLFILCTVFSHLYWQKLVDWSMKKCETDSYFGRIGLVSLNIFILRNMQRKLTLTKSFTFPDILSTFGMSELCCDKLDFFDISGTLLVTWTCISPFVTPSKGIHLSTVSFGGSLSYSTTQLPMLYVGNIALWSFTWCTKWLPVSGNSKVWFHWGLNVL